MSKRKCAQKPWMKAIDEIAEASRSARVIAHACRGARFRVTAKPDPAAVVEDFTAIEQSVHALRKRLRKAVDAIDV